MVADYSAVLAARGKLVSEPMLLNFFRGQSDRFEPEPTDEGVFQVPAVFLANSEGAQKGPGWTPRRLLDLLLAVFAWVAKQERERIPPGSIPRVAETYARAVDGQFTSR